MTQSHLLTNNFDDYGYEFNGFLFEDVIGYGMPYPLYDSYPLYAYDSVDYERHYYTTDWEEF